MTEESLQSIVNKCSVSGKFVRRNHKDMFERYCGLIDAASDVETNCSYCGMKVVRELGYGMNHKLRKVYLCNYERTK